MVAVGNVLESISTLCMSVSKNSLQLHHSAQMRLVESSNGVAFQGICFIEHCSVNDNVDYLCEVIE